jgi:pimeloyl-ACP methyl ester carboxylesterase
MRAYDSCAALSKRLMSINPRLTEPRATFLSQQVSYIRPDGLVAMACDPWHKIPAPHLYRVEDTIASWKRIAAPTLLLVAEDGLVHGHFEKSPGEVARRLAAFKDKQIHTILDSGHNVQHDQPEQVALHLEHFLKQ